MFFHVFFLRCGFGGSLVELCVFLLELFELVDCLEEGLILLLSLCDDLRSGANPFQILEQCREV